MKEQKPDNAQIMSSRSKKPGVTFQILFQDQWIPLDGFLDNPEPLWKSWLNDD